MELLAVTNRNLCQGDFLKQIEKLSTSGITAIILREKDLLPAEYLQLAQQCQNILATTNVTFIINQKLEIAKQLGILTVQLSFPAFQQQWRNMNNFERILVSVHTYSEAVQAEQWGASGLLAGHIFRTECKKGLEPRGIAFLNQICFAVQIPVYAIGGITAITMPLVQKSQAAGVCMMSEAMQETFFWMPH